MFRSWTTLYELTDGRFQKMERLDLSPILSGYRYLLVEKALAEWIEQAGIERVKSEAIVIYDPWSKEEIKTHARLRVTEFFELARIHDLALDGLRIFSMGEEYYFASPELKMLLEQSHFKYIRFSEGLSGFAAHQP
jgi:hypothetical protein